VAGAVYLKMHVRCAAPVYIAVEFLDPSSVHYSPTFATPFPQFKSILENLSKGDLVTFSGRFNRRTDYAYFQNFPDRIDLFAVLTDLYKGPRRPSQLQSESVRDRVYKLAESAGAAKLYISERVYNGVAFDKVGIGAPIASNQYISRFLVRDSGTIVIEGSAKIIGASVTMIFKPLMPPNNTSMMWKCGVSSPEMFEIVPSACKNVLIP